MNKTNKSEKRKKYKRSKAKRRSGLRILLYISVFSISLVLIRHFILLTRADMQIRTNDSDIMEEISEDNSEVENKDLAESDNAVEDNPDAVSVIGAGEWMLTLVNEKNPLSDNYLPKLKKLANGLQFDERAIGKLNAMLSDARAQGLDPIVCSAYRNIEKQRKLFNADVNKYISKGLSREQAEIETKKSVAYPGASEHNLGLAVDIVSKSYQHLNEKQAETPEMKWLIKHCAEYGFILRYPEGKEDITGVTYEPWHFRFVGVSAAQKIMQDGITLEEYLMNSY